MSTDKSSISGVILVIILLISLAALFLGASAYLRPPEKIESTKLSETAPVQFESYEGPKYTGTGTGYVIEVENGKRIYFSGDTTLISDFKYVIHDYYHPDIALIPTDGFYCMDPGLASVAASWIDAAYVIPYHYGTFPEMPIDPKDFADRVNSLRAQNETRTEPFIAEIGKEWELEGIKATWLGHGSYLIITPGGSRILIDPWLEANPSCPTAFKDITYFGETYGGVDLVLLTHGHVDHFTLEEVVDIWEMYRAPVVAQWELGGYISAMSDVPVVLINKGGILTKEKMLLQGIVPADAINSKQIDSRLKIMMVQADHSSSAL